MSYTREQAIEFWFEVDDIFKDHTPQEVVTLYIAIFGQNFDIDRIWNLWKRHRAASTYPDGFQTAISAFANSLVQIGTKQLEMIDRYFNNDQDALRLAFEDFGQGVLYDDVRNPDGSSRRRINDRVHQMDGDSGVGMVGYHRWHTIIRAMVLAGADPSRWLEIDRFVSLAWAIQSEARPVSRRRNNPGLPEQRISELRTIWLQRSVEQLDNAFDSFPYPLYP